VFNLADSWLVLGAAVLLWISLRPTRLPPDDSPPDDRARPAGPMAADAKRPPSTTVMPGVLP
jgi:hypothetical protein